MPNLFEEFYGGGTTAVAEPDAPPSAAKPSSLFAPFLATPADFGPQKSPSSVPKIQAEQQQTVAGLNTLTRARSIPEAQKFELAESRMLAADVASRRQSWTGRFEERLAKTALGQTLLRAEQGLGDVARGAVSLGARAAGAESVADNIHREKRVREAWLSEIEKGGDIESLLGPTGSKVYSGVTKSLAQISPGAKLAGAAGVYGTIGGVAYDDGLEEAKQLGLTGGADVAYAGKKAVWEMGVTHLMGAVGKKFGLESLEESLTPGLRNAASKIGERIGIADKLKQLVGAAGGATLEGVEEALVDAGQQAIELAEKRDGAFDWDRTLMAGLTGVAARGATGAVKGIKQSLASAKHYVEQTVAGTLAAEKTLRGDDGEVAINKLLASTNAKSFADATGIRRSKPAFREAYLETVELYVPATQPESSVDFADRFAREQPGDMAKNYDSLIAKEFGGADNVISADVAKYAIPGFDATQSGAYHDPASRFAKARAQELLARDDTKPVLLLAGGSGAGKTSALRTFATDLSQYALVHDTNMTSVSGASKRIDDALASGRDAEVAFTWRDPVEAFVHGVLPRVRKEGRIVPLDAHVRTHLGSRATFDALREKYKDNPAVTFRVTDNSRGKGKSTPIPVDNVPSVTYTSEQLKETLHAELDNARAAGTVTDAEYATFLGGKDSRQEQAGGRDNPEALGRPEQGVVGGGIELVSEKEVAPLPPGIRPSIVWDESGALHLPDVTKPIAHGVSDAYVGVRGFRERFTNSLETQLGVVAERAPDHLRPAAKAAARTLVATGQRVLETGRSIAGALQPLYHKVRRRAGGATFTGASWEAQQDGETVAAADGSAVGGDTVLMQLVEQKRPLTSVTHPELADYVNDVVALNDARGRLYEKLPGGSRRPVPTSRLAQRLSTLGSMSDNELKAEFRALFPKHKTVLTSRARLIEKLQSIEFFKNKGGNVWQRIGTPVTHEIRALGEAHRLWLPLSKLIAAKTGQTLESVQVDMRSHFLSAEKKHSIEVPRELEWFPAWIETNGRREWLLETHPAAHAQKVHEDFTQRMGNLAVFGDPLAEPAVNGERITPQDAMRNAAVNTGLPPNLVDAYFNALAGLPTDRNVTEQGESSQATTPWKSLYNLILAGKLTASAAYGVVEPLGTMRRMAGVKRVAKAFDQQIRRGQHAEALNDIRRGGAFASEYANFTFNRQAFVSGLAGQMSDVALTGSLARPFWNQNAELSALLGWQIARDFEAGVASKGDRDMLVRDLGYTRPEADAFFNRQAKQADYDGLIQRFASRTTTAKITNPTEESAVRALGVGPVSGGAFRALIPFSRYTLFKSREAANIVRSMKANWALVRQGDAEAPARIARDLYSAGDFVVGGAFAGLAGNLLRHLVFYGPEEGFGLWWEDVAPTEGNPFRPLAAAAAGFAANGLGFIGGNLFWALGEKGLDNVQEAILGVSPGSGVFVEGLQALGSLVAIEGGGKLGYGRYRKAASGLDVFTTWVAANAPGLRAAANYAGDVPVVGAYLAPLAYGSRDQELDAARIRMFRWLDEQGFGPPTGAPGNVPPEQANFVRHMRAFQMEARKEEPMSATRKAVLREHLQNAFGTRTNTPQEVRQRILDMRLLKYMPSDELRAQFKKEYPERFKKLAQHDMGLEAWANFAHRPK